MLNTEFNTLKNFLLVLHYIGELNPTNGFESEVNIWVVKHVCKFYTEYLCLYNRINPREAFAQSSITKICN